MKWENVYVFISSTFNDMHAERDYLVKNVFPALSEWCEERKLRLIDIDLRWGVTTADSEAKNTVMACLKNIDECRPFFLCFLGQRRGWVPTDDDINPDTYKSFPKLLEKKCKYASVTELEILHALIDPLHNGTFKDRKNNDRKGNPVEYAFFFLRNKEYLENLPHKDLSLIYTNEIEKDRETADKKLNDWRDTEIPNRKKPYKYSAKWRLEETTPEVALSYEVPSTAQKNSIVWKRAYNSWKERWKIAGIDVDESGIIKEGTEQRQQAETYNKNFTQGRLGDFSVDDKILSDIIIEQLKNAIAERYKEHMALMEQTPLQKEIDQQEQFLRIASEGFIERTGDFDVLSGYINNEETCPLALTAFAGMGKTSLLAHFIDKYELKNNETLYYRFVGNSDDSINVERLFRSILEQIKETGKIKSIIPVDYTDMMNKLPDLLTEAGKNGKIIIIIDALNQLESGMNDLNWIPTKLPENTKLIVSFKLGEKSADDYYNKQKANMVFHSVKPFDSKADRKALVAAYLERYFKELDEDRIENLITLEGADNPLYLKAVLSELRVFGIHNDLSKVINERFKDTPKSAFNAILERIENDPAYSKFKPAVALPNIFGWIAHSHYGMSPEELVDITIREKLTDNKTEAYDTIYLILRQLRPFLAKRDGRVDFFYESFKSAAIERYTNNHIYSRTSLEWHRSLAEYFETLPMENQHRLMEQAWQYVYAEKGNEYVNLLLNNDYMYFRLKMFDIHILLNDFSLMSKIDSKVSENFNLLNIIYKSLKLSAFVLKNDKSQLPSQLYARNSGSRIFKNHNLAQNFRKYPIPWLLAETPGTLSSSNNNLILTLETHAKYHKNLLLTRNNETLISLSSDGVLCFWDMKTGKLISSIKGEDIRNIYLVENDTLLVALSLFQIKTYSIETGKEIKEKLFYATDGITDITKDRKTIYFIHKHDENVIMKYNLTKTFVETAVQHNKKIVSRDSKSLIHLKISEDSKFLITSTDKNQILVFDTNTKTCIFTFSVDSHDINYLELSPNARYIASASSRLSVEEHFATKYMQNTPNYNIFIFNLKTGQEKLLNMGEFIGITCMKFIDDVHLLVNKATGVILLWNIETNKIIRDFTCKQGYISFFLLNRKNQIAALTNDGQINIIDYSDGKHISTLYISEPNYCDSAKIINSQDGNILIGSSEDKLIKIWDLSIENENDWCNFHNESVKKIHLTNQSKNISSISKTKIISFDCNLKNMNTLNFSEHKLFDAIQINNNDYAIAFDNSPLIGFSKNNSYIIIDKHIEPINHIIHNDKNNSFMSIDKSGYILLWNKTTKTVVQRLDIPHSNYRSHTNPGAFIHKDKRPSIYGASFSEKGNFALFFLCDGRIAIWDLNNIAELKVSKNLILHKIRSLFSKNGRKRLHFLKNIDFKNINKDSITMNDVLDIFISQQYGFLNELIHNIPPNIDITNEELIDMFKQAFESYVLISFNCDKIVYVQENTVFYKDLKNNITASFTDEVKITALKFMADDRIIVGNNSGKIYKLEIIN